MTNVLLAQRVTPLAMLHNSPSGVQPQVSRHASIEVCRVMRRCSSSKKAANRGYAPDATDVFNAIGIKANSAFMPKALNPQPP